eukprot:369205_1
MSIIKQTEYEPLNRIDYFDKNGAGKFVEFCQEFENKSFINMLSVGPKIMGLMGKSYLRFLADLYARDRIMYYMEMKNSKNDKNIESKNKEKEATDATDTLTLSKWILLNKHLLTIKTFSKDKHEFNMIKLAV